MVLAISDGGTGATTAAAARQNLGTDLSANVKFSQTSTSTVRSVEDKLREACTPLDFGAQGNSTYVGGVFTAGANDTAAMLAFINHCIDTGSEGYIPPGGYHVDWGTLAFDNGNVDTPWPVIRTAGHESVTFYGRGNADAPMISITNGETAVANDQMWHGGELGGFTVRNILSQAAKSNRHALELRGIQESRFGVIQGLDLQGSTLFIPNKLTGGTNPDPYHVYACDFQAVIGFRNLQFVVENRNFHGLVGNRFGSIRASNAGYMANADYAIYPPSGHSSTEAQRRDTPRVGCWYGFGASNRVGALTVSTSRGWALHDGSDVNCVGGVPAGFVVEAAELDDPEFGIFLGRAKFCAFRQFRFIHRKPASATSTFRSNPYWPRVAVQFGKGYLNLPVAPDSQHCQLTIEHRIDGPAGTKSDLGAFTDFNDWPSYPFATKIELTMQDGMGYDIEPGDLFSNLHPASGVRIDLWGKPIHDALPRSLASASYTGSGLSVPATGYASSAAILAFSNVRFDIGGDYGNDGNGWTAPYSGFAQFHISLPLNLASGTRVRLGVMEKQGSTYYMTGAHRRVYQSVTGVQHHALTQIVQVTQGLTYYAIADQGSGASVTVSPEFSLDECTFQVRMV